MEELLVRGADPDIKNKKGKTPLDLAKELNHSSRIVDLLTKYQKEKHEQVEIIDSSTEQQVVLCANDQNTILATKEDRVNMDNSSLDSKVSSLLERVLANNQSKLLTALNATVEECITKQVSAMEDRIKKDKNSFENKQTRLLKALKTQIEESVTNQVSAIEDHLKEGNLSLGSKILSLEKLSENNQKKLLTAIKTQIDCISKQVSTKDEDRLKVDVLSLDSKVSSLERSMSNLKDSMDHQKVLFQNDVKALKTLVEDKISKQQVSVIENRIGQVESKVSSIEYFLKHHLDSKLQSSFDKLMDYFEEMLTKNDPLFADESKSSDSVDEEESVDDYASSTEGSISKDDNLIEDENSTFGTDGDIMIRDRGGKRKKVDSEMSMRRGKKRRDMMNRTPINSTNRSDGGIANHLLSLGSKLIFAGSRKAK